MIEYHLQVSANFEEFIGKFVYTSVSNVSKEFGETDASYEKAFETSTKSSSNIGTNTKSFLTTQFSNAAGRLFL